jgi:hypothetical protein
MKKNASSPEELPQPAVSLESAESPDFSGLVGRKRFQEPKASRFATAGAK